MLSILLPDMPSEWRDTGERLFYLRLIDVLNSMQNNISETATANNTAASKEETAVAWKEFTVENFTNWGAQDPFGVALIDGVVYLRGAGKLASALANKSTVSIGTLPEGYRPEYRVALPLISDGGLVRLTVNTTGGLVLRNASGASIADSVYISLACCFPVKAHAEEEEPVEPGSETYLFNRGAVEGYTFVSNSFTRPNYTGGAAGVIESDYLRVKIPSLTGSTSIPYNAHVCTSTFVAIPSTATKLKVLAKKTSATNTLLNFGLLPTSAANSYSTKNGGQLSGDKELTMDEAVYEITLTDTVKAATNLKCIVNAKANMKIGTAAANAIIYQIWFE